MKIFKYLLIAGIAALGLSSCSSDYLDTAPTAETGTATAFETTDNVKLAINGCARVMMNQYLGTQASTRTTTTRPPACTPTTPGSTTTN